MTFHLDSHMTTKVEIIPSLEMSRSSLFLFNFFTCRFIMDVMRKKKKDEALTGGEKQPLQVRIWMVGSPSIYHNTRDGYNPYTPY